MKKPKNRKGKIIFIDAKEELRIERTNAWLEPHHIKKILSEGLDFAKHSGVISNIHQRFVKTGKLSKDQGKSLNWLFELRSIGDYGVTDHVSQKDSEEAIRIAESFLNAIKILIQNAVGEV